MNTYLMLVLRIIHILAGVLWVGAAIVYFAFIEPTIKSIGPAGQQFIQHFIGRQRYPLFMNTASALTIIAGALLYLSDSGGLKMSWIKTGPGLGFTIGSAVAIVVYFIGFLMLRPRAERLGALGREIAMAGGGPSPQQASELHKLDQELSKIERVDVVLLTIALLTMATARYWWF